MSTETSTQSTLLTLPRELRDDIYEYLNLKEHVFTSSPKPKTHSLHSMTTSQVAYCDSRIYLPVRPAPNVLGTCRQLRAEYLEYINHLMSYPSKLLAIPESEPIETPESNILAAREHKAAEESADRARDDGSVRITIEVLRTIDGGFASLVPTRDQPSPRFLAIAPMFGELHKVKFNVWPGWDWWFGPPVKRRIKTSRARFKRLTPDQQDVMMSTSEEGNDVEPMEPQKPDPLTVAISSLLMHLPSVDEIHVDVLMHGYAYCNMDLPENRWEHVRGWLDKPVSFQNGRTMKKVYRRIVAIDTSQNPVRSAAFYQKLETWEPRADDKSKAVVHVAEGHRVISEEEFYEGPAELGFTTEYDRFE